MQSYLKPPNTRRQQGSTLLEVVIAMAIFSVGILGMATLQTRVLLEAKDQRQRDIVIWKAQSLIERISNNNAPLVLDQYVASINNANICANPPAAICADSYVGNAKVNAATCSASQMATYDSWEILCPDNEGASDQINSLTPRLDCASALCLLGEDMTLLFLWTSHAATGDPRLIGQTTAVLLDGGISMTINANAEGYRVVFKP